MNSKFIDIREFSTLELHAAIGLTTFDAWVCDHNAIQYKGVVANAKVDSRDVWSAFWTEENENDYDFCLTYYYNGDEWIISLSGIQSTLGNVYDGIPSLMSNLIGDGVGYKKEKEN